ncbi:MAG: sulfotransferase [Chloroflexi bacterium]|nr:sulfotransferase [Chloroflexota bacterium]
MLLGVGPRSFVAGELALIFDRWLGGRQVCSCGHLLQDCPVWSAVMERFRSRIPGASLVEARGLTDRLERLVSGGALGSINRRARERYGQIWAEMLASISEVTGSLTIVDTSKSAHPRARRPFMLASETGTDVRVVVLMRDPRAVMWSVAAAGSRKGGAKLLAVERTLASWIATYAYASRLRRGGQIRTTTVRYEELTLEPRAVLERAGRELDLDFSAAVAAAEQRCNIASEHAFAGNAIRRDPVTVLRPASSDGMTRLHRHRGALARAAALVARRYGYR